MGRATYFIAAIFAGLLLGIFSAVNALGSYGLVAVAAHPGWAEWQLNSGDTKLIYTLGHFLSGGQLPPPKLAQSFVRTTDDEGNSLRSDCIYVVKGEITPARWWTMSINQAGGLSAHSVLTAGEALVDKDGVLKITVSQHPMPGNWLQPDGGSVSLVYVIHEAPNGETIQLPSITNKGC
jgi:hypothetical protein